MLEIENMYLFSNISLTLRFEDGVIEFGAKFTIQWCFYNDDINDLIFFLHFFNVFSAFTVKSLETIQNQMKGWSEAFR